MSRLLEAIPSPKELRALPEEPLDALCAKLRERIIQVCGRTGGHLGASLGAVELIVALHRTFKTPHDSIVFDVGHQAYAHKLLTGRAARMDTLRQEGGLAPFTDPTESEHDAFVAGHACTAVSAALGILQANVLQKRPGRAVAVVGDGALTGGLTFEGLNNAGQSGLPLVIVLNDNQMSISRNVGAVAELLRSRDARHFFEALGFTYLGPVDGHDLRALLTALAEARRSQRPLVLHARTQKGKGLAEAESDARTRGHAMGPYELRDGKLVRSRHGLRTFSEAFAAALERAMEQDERVVAVTPAMLEGSALTELKERYPSRVFDVGIAEQHAVTFSAGLASRGLRPVCALYATFLQRAVDQVIHDVALLGLPVTFAVDRAGLVGADGATHQGAFDLALLRAIPGMTLMAPMVGEDLPGLLSAALSANGPVAIRFPRATLPPLPAALSPCSATPRGRWLARPPRPGVVFLSTGPVGLAAREAASGDPGWAALDIPVIQPVDAQAFAQAADCGAVITVEEGTVHGGLGSAFLEWCAAQGRTPRVRCIGLPDRFIRHGDARAQRHELGLDAEGLRRAAREFAGRGR